MLGEVSNRHDHYHRHHHDHHIIIMGEVNNAKICMTTIITITFMGKEDNAKITIIIFMGRPRNLEGDDGDDGGISDGDGDGDGVL